MKFEVIFDAQNIVDIIQAISWPIAALIIVFLLKSKFAKAFEAFFSRNNVTEFSVGGLSAKFAEYAQGRKSVMPATLSTIIGQNYSQHEEFHKYNQSKHSKAHLNKIRANLASYEISCEEKLEIAEIDLSIFFAWNQYITVNKFLYKSQFDLLNKMTQSEGLGISIPEANNHFDSVKQQYVGSFDSFDLALYMSYLLSSGLIIRSDGQYLITDYGESYVEYMNQYPYLIPQLLQF